MLYQLSYEALPEAGYMKRMALQYTHHIIHLFLICSPLLCQYVVSLDSIFAIWENSLRTKLTDFCAFLWMMSLLKGSIEVFYCMLTWTFNLSSSFPGSRLCRWARSFVVGVTVSRLSKGKSATGRDSRSPGWAASCEYPLRHNWWWKPWFMLGCMLDLDEQASYKCDIFVQPFY